ncbi:sensor histidine kinase [Desulfolucanica intricata]|uniref:sensor histidine kinase n=1 Tax=Desulfolucanica intricata TaxID=1285191 RepID=UPI0008336450|nr:GHKL domain-containing protein [Desulfolucanica intricata]
MNIAKKSIEKLIIFLLVEICLVLLTARVINFYEDKISVSDILITVVAVLNFGIGIFIIKWLFKVDCFNNELRLQKVCLEATDEALKLMRTERHDFINHLQSIYGLIVAGEHNEAAGYIKDIGIDCRFNSQILNIKNPSLRTLLQNKKETATVRNIEFNISVESDLMFLDIKPSAITTVFGNLLDNAIDAVTVLDKDHRKAINFEITETESFYNFFIQNSGPPINEEIAQNIFIEGFSTKGTGRGYGLALSKKIVKGYGGKVLYDLKAKNFSVILPKQKELL